MIAATEAAIGTGGSDQREPARCSVCGDRREDPNSLLPVCYGCRLDALLPSWYAAWEDYDPRLGTARAHPKTGVRLLDAAGPARCWAIARTMGTLAIITTSYDEQLMGLDDDFWRESLIIPDKFLTTITQRLTETRRGKMMGKRRK